MKHLAGKVRGIGSDGFSSGSEPNSHKEKANCQRKSKRWLPQARITLLRKWGMIVTWCRHLAYNMSIVDVTYVRTVWLTGWMRCTHKVFHDCACRDMHIKHLGVDMCWSYGWCAKCQLSNWHITKNTRSNDDSIIRFSRCSLQMWTTLLVTSNCWKAGEVKEFCSALPDQHRCLESSTQSANIQKPNL